MDCSAALISCVGGGVEAQAAISNKLPAVINTRGIKFRALLVVSGVNMCVLFLKING
jgi:hypothetical protein